MPDPLVVGDERVLDIGPIAHGGHFVAHSDGRTWFVRHAITGERVRARVTDVTAKIVRADAVEVIDASPDRVPAPCPWAHPDGCGGCDFQHVALPAQRRLKRQVLVDALRRFGHVDDEALLDAIEVAELPGTPDGLGWRTRMQWATAPDGTRGLCKHRSHDVVALDRCLIAAPGHDRPSAANRREAPTGKVVHTMRDRTWRLGADDFWQVHPAAAAALVDAVLPAADPRPGQTWWDLYSGAGLFAAFLGEAVGPAGRVEAVEADDRGVRAARRALHDLPQVHLNHADVRAWLVAGAGDRSDQSPDGVVLDPPRSGAGAEVVRAIAGTGASTVVYVACDPVALGRDVATFAGNGYRLAGVQGFDGFPMTGHVEAVAVLRRRLT